jgi:hypothetical protein
VLPSSKVTLSDDTRHKLQRSRMYQVNRNAAGTNAPLVVVVIIMINVKVTLVQVIKAQRECVSTALLFL